MKKRRKAGTLRLFKVRIVFGKKKTEREKITKVERGGGCF